MSHKKTLSDSLIGSLGACPFSEGLSQRVSRNLKEQHQ
jgi:hypothetical protein